MGTWSIEPDNDKVTINEDNGTVVFDEHEEDATYVIRYVDGEIKIEKTVTVHGCSAPEKSCEIKAKITGLEDNDTAIINWGDGIIEENKANGEHTHTIHKDSSTVSVSARGYVFNPASGQINCSGMTEFTATTSDTCDCNSISSSVDSYDLYYDNNATEKEVTLCKFTTNGCGSVSANSTDSQHSDMFVGGNVKVYSLNSKGVRDDNTYVENAYGYEVCANLTKNEGNTRSAGITIYVKEKGGAVWGKCDELSIFVQQSDSFCDCKAVSLPTEKIVTADATNSGPFTSQELSSTCSSSPYALKYTIEKGENINRMYISSGSKDQLFVILDPNSSKATNEIEIKVEAYTNVTFKSEKSYSYVNEDWSGGAVCATGKFKIIQNAAKECGCNDIGTVKFGTYRGYEYAYKELRIDSSDGGTNYSTLIIDSSCYSVSITPTASTDTNFITEVTIGNYDSSMHAWPLTIKYTENQSEEDRETDIVFKFCEGKEYKAHVVQAARNVCKNCESDFKNKFKFFEEVSGESNGRTSYVAYYSGSCDVDVEYVSGTPEWVTDWAKYQYGRNLQISPVIKPNFNTTKRDFKYKFKTTIDGVECTTEEKTFNQLGASGCTCDNLRKDSGYRIFASDDGKQVHPGDEFTAGTVTVYSKNTLLNCFSASISTEQGGYVDIASSEIVEKTEPFYVEDNKFCRKFDIIVQIKDLTLTADQDVTVDFHLNKDGSECAATRLIAKILKNS